MRIDRILFLCPHLSLFMGRVQYRAFHSLLFLFFLHHHFPRFKPYIFIDFFCHLFSPSRISASHIFRATLLWKSSSASCSPVPSPPHCIRPSIFLFRMSLFLSVITSLPPSFPAIPLPTSPSSPVAPHSCSLSVSSFP